MLGERCKRVSRRSRMEPSSEIRARRRRALVESKAKDALAGLARSDVESSASQKGQILMMMMPRLPTCARRAVAASTASAVVGLGMGWQASLRIAMVCGWSGGRAWRGSSTRLAKPKRAREGQARPVRAKCLRPARMESLRVAPRGIHGCTDSTDSAALLGWDANSDKAGRQRVGAVPMRAIPEDDVEATSECCMCEPSFWTCHSPFILVRYRIH